MIGYWQLSAKRTALWRCAARVLACTCMLALLPGCLFTGVRCEPANAPTFRYVNPKLQAVAHDIPLVLDYSDCVEDAMVTDVGVLGGRDFNGTFPLRLIVLREFGHFVDDNMRQPQVGEAEKLILKIYSKCILVDQRGDDSHAEMTFDIQLIDPSDADKRPYFRGTFKSSRKGIHKDDTMVPMSVYQAVRNIVSDFTKALVNDPSAMRRLELLARPGARVARPTLTDFTLDPQRNGIVSGRCQVECNGWGEFDADNWARTEIRRRCQENLNVEFERLRVVYSKYDYIAQSKSWRYEFRAFARAPMVMDYDPETRTGVCIGDLGLLRLSIDNAALKMREFVVAEMRTHGGLVDSAKGDEKTRVRFKEVKTDEVNNILQIGFSLPY